MSLGKIFSSVVAIKALGKISKKFINVTTDLNVSFQFEGSFAKKFGVNEENYLEVQQKRLERIPKQIHMNARGTGIAFASVSCDYYEKISGTTPSYDLKVGVESSNDHKTININIRAKAIPRNGPDVNGMTIIEAKLPSGYMFLDKDKMYSDLHSVGVKASVK